MEDNDCYDNYKTLGQTISDWKDEFEEETPNKASTLENSLYMASILTAILTLRNLLWKNKKFKSGMCILLAFVRL